MGDGIVDHGCTVEEREAVVNRSIAVLLYEYYETLDDVAETGTVSNINDVRTVITFTSTLFPVFKVLASLCTY